jgi:hypothetical protein
MPNWLRGIDRRHDRHCLLPLAAAEEMEHGSEPSGVARPSRDLQERATPSHWAVELPRDMCVRSTVHACAACSAGRCSGRSGPGWVGCRSIQ